MEEKGDGIQGSDGGAQGRGPAEDDRSPQPAKGGCWDCAIGPRPFRLTWMWTVDFLSPPASFSQVGNKAWQMLSLVKMSTGRQALGTFCWLLASWPTLLRPTPPNKLFIQKKKIQPIETQNT